MSGSGLPISSVSPSVVLDGGTRARRASPSVQLHLLVFKTHPRETCQHPELRAEHQTDRRFCLGLSAPQGFWLASHTYTICSLKKIELRDIFSPRLLRINYMPAVHRQSTISWQRWLNCIHDLPYFGLLNVFIYYLLGFGCLTPIKLFLIIEYQSNMNML